MTQNSVLNELDHNARNYNGITDPFSKVTKIISEDDSGYVREILR